MEDFCLIIPTNRLIFIKNIINFYSATKINVKIVHNLKVNFDNYKFYNIQFVYIEDKNPFKRVAKLLKVLNESYCQIFSDDDFVFEDTLIKSVDYLKNNLDYSSAQGLQLNFYYENLNKFEFDDLNFPLINRESDSFFKNIRLFQAFTSRYVDRIYSISKKEILLDILETAEPLFIEYQQCMEIYFICCLTMVGRDKVFQEIGWMKGQHANNLHKNEKYLTDYWIFNKKFISLFFLCLKNYSKRRKIKNFSFIYFIIVLFIFKIKIILVGYFKGFRIFFSKIRNLEKKKKIKLAEDIYFKDILKIKNLKSVIVKNNDY
jgi:glycosyltransferase domain-containing protein